MLWGKIFGRTSLSSQLFGYLDLLLGQISSSLFSLLNLVQCLLMLFLCGLGLLLSEEISLSELLSFLLGFFNNRTDSLGFVQKRLAHPILKVGSHNGLLFSLLFSPSFSDSGDPFVSNLPNFLRLFKLSKFLGFILFLLDSL